MGRKNIILALVLVTLSLTVSAQQKDSVRVRLNHYTLTFGTGWTHYINNLENFDNNIRKDFVGFAGKFYWEPEYRLSLGLETGYYRMFKVSGHLDDNTAIDVTRTVVPLLLLARMRIVDNVYLGAGLGMAIITNKSEGGGQKIITKTTSLANFELSGAYIYPMSKHWLVGGEVKAFHFATYSDWMYSVQATISFKL
jgi:hypothetical protein